MSAGLVWDWRWQSRSGWLGGTWGGYTELAGSYWRNDTRLTAPKREFVQFGVTPVLRYWMDQDPGWFIEAGIGLNVISPKYDSGRREPFSTTFNFGDHLGFGWRAPAQGAQAGDEWSLRLQHFSNASIRRPNPGVNFIQLRWTRPL